MLERDSQVVMVSWAAQRSLLKVGSRVLSTSDFVTTMTRLEVRAALAMWAKAAWSTERGREGGRERGCVITSTHDFSLPA